MEIEVNRTQAADYIMELRKDAEWVLENEPRRPSAQRLIKEQIEALIVAFNALHNC